MMCYNVNVLIAHDQRTGRWAGKGRLNYLNVTWHPFVNGLPFQYMNVSGPDGTYVKYIKSYNYKDDQISVSDV